MGIRLRQRLRELLRQMATDPDRGPADFVGPLIDVLLQEDEDIERDAYEKRRISE